ncbi:hypothetical protein [Bradyrhizobium elkanii]|uniref:hypothetical protein n=1 Tax=Bradyrhizobium elkanii TaxID=29448 RepID=UPI001BA59860|nr:hypothetical protein [Bradyrhizobium elkanii]MBR1164525.1 hypothetical protein [Bradyrhizobium elkanii]
MNVTYASLPSIDDAAAGVEPATTISNLVETKAEILRALITPLWIRSGEAGLRITPYVRQHIDVERCSCASGGNQPRLALVSQL